MHERLLIVGTVPYNEMSTSRAFDAYFHFWEHENMAQVFSHTKTPCKGHCGTLFQITDQRIVKRWMGKKIETGKEFMREDLPDAWENNTAEVDGQAMKKAYKFGTGHTPLTHLLRGILWRKRFWNTKKLNEWLDAFKPEAVFLAWSDDYFILNIALYIAKKYNIPMIPCIGDDYYFNTRFSLNPFYWIYKSSYRRLVRKTLSYANSAFYISDKIRDKYNTEFNLHGETVYLTSTVERRPFAPLNKENPVITYFGNIRMGRNHSLSDIADALREVNPAYKLEVYSGEKDETYTKVLSENPSIDFKGGVPYAEVRKRMAESDITVIVEGFEKADVDKSRYSLSTKAADALRSGCTILTYGSRECGIVEYMESTEASFVCTEKAELRATIERMFSADETRETYYEKQIQVTEAHHNLRSSTGTIERIVTEEIANHGKE